MLKIKVVTIISVGVFTFCVSQPVFSNDDSYLRALEEEAQSVDLVKEDLIPEQNVDTQPEQRSEIESGLSKQPMPKNIRKEFLAKLKVELPATNRSFHRLSDDDQKAVIKKYQSSNEDMTAAIHLIFNLYFKHKP